MGHHHQTGHQLAEPSPEHLHTDAVWGHDGGVHKGTPQHCVCVQIVYFVCFICTQRLNAVDLFLQKHEDESEGWLHRQVRILTQSCWLYFDRWHFGYSVGYFLYDDHQNKVFSQLHHPVIRFNSSSALSICVVSYGALFLCFFNWLIVCVSSEWEASVF